MSLLASDVATQYGCCEETGALQRREKKGEREGDNLFPRDLLPLGLVRFDVDSDDRRVVYRYIICFNSFVDVIIIDATFY